MDFNRSKKAHFKENTTAFTKKEENETVVDLHRQILDAPSPLFANFFVIYVQFSGNIGRLAPPPTLGLVTSAKSCIHYWEDINILKRSKIRTIVVFQVPIRPAVRFEERSEAGLGAVRYGEMHGRVPVTVLQVRGGVRRHQAVDHRPVPRYNRNVKSCLEK